MSEIRRIFAATLLAVLALGAVQAVAQEPRVLPAGGVEALRNGSWVTIGVGSGEPELCRISDSWFDMFVFGGTVEASDRKRKTLDSRLGNAVDKLVQTHNLTPAQKQKLELAGRGDIKRWFDRTEDCRQRFQLPGVLRNERDVRAFQASFLAEANRLRTDSGNIFGPGSLLAKTLSGIRRE